MVASSANFSCFHSVEADATKRGSVLIALLSSWWGATQWKCRIKSKRRTPWTPPSTPSLICCARHTWTTRASFPEHCCRHARQQHGQAMVSIASCRCLRGDADPRDSGRIHFWLTPWYPQVAISCRDVLQSDLIRAVLESWYQPKPLNCPKSWVEKDRPLFLGAQGPGSPTTQEELPRGSKELVATNGLQAYSHCPLLALYG